MYFYTHTLLNSAVYSPPALVELLVLLDLLVSLARADRAVMPYTKTAVDANSLALRVWHDVFISLALLGYAMTIGLFVILSKAKNLFWTNALFSALTPDFARDSSLRYAPVENDGQWCAMTL